MRVLPIEDSEVSAAIGSDLVAGYVSLTFEFQDKTNHGLRAKVELAIEPEEAVDMVDKLIAELIRLGVKLEVADKITEIVEVKAGPHA